MRVVVVIVSQTHLLFPFVSSEDETPIRHAQRIGLSSSLEANGP